MFLNSAIVLFVYLISILLGYEVSEACSYAISGGMWMILIGAFISFLMFIDDWGNLHNETHEFQDLQQINKVLISYLPQSKFVLTTAGINWLMIQVFTIYTLLFSLNIGGGYLIFSVKEG